jgi:aspartyl-tRNA(Asn)/glutamyl-tRNA(Gln) amidotransferase subunit A
VTTPKAALDAAAKVDADRAAGKPLGKLAGVPIGMKDLFATKGVQTTAASHSRRLQAEYESTVSQKLWDAGAGLLGKLNLTSSPWVRPMSPAILAAWCPLAP